MICRRWLIGQPSTWLLRRLSGGRDVAGSSLANVTLSLIDRKLVIRVLDHVRNAITYNMKTPVIVIVLPAALTDQQLCGQNLGWSPNCWHPGLLKPGGVALEFSSSISTVATYVACTLLSSFAQKYWLLRVGGGIYSMSVGRNMQCECNTLMLSGGGWVWCQSWVHFGSRLAPPCKFWHPPSHNLVKIWGGHPIVGALVCWNLGALHWSFHLQFQQLQPMLHAPYSAASLKSIDCWGWVVAFTAWVLEGTCNVNVTR